MDATDTLLCVINDSASRYLCIEKIIVSAVAAGLIEIGVHDAPGTPAGSAVTPTCLNRTANTTCAASAWEDQTAATTLLNVAEVHVGVGTPTTIEFGGALILGEDDCVSVDIITELAISSATIIGYFRDKA